MDNSGLQPCCSEPPLTLRPQNIFGGLAGLGSAAQVQLESQRADDRLVATAAVHGRAGETDMLLVFSNNSTVRDVS